MSERRDFFIYIKNEKKKLHQIFIYMKKGKTSVFQCGGKKNCKIEFRFFLDNLFKLIYIKKKTSLNFRNVI